MAPLSEPPMSPATRSATPASRRRYGGRRCGAVFAAALLTAPLAKAAEIGIEGATGQPGDEVSVFVTIDSVPADASGSYALDLDLGFDTTAVAVEAVRKGSLAAQAFDYEVQAVDLVSAGAAPPIRLDLSALFGSLVAGTGFVPNPSPGGGTLFEVVFRILPGAAGGPSEITLTLENASEDTTALAVAPLGAIDVVAEPAATEKVPLPAAALPISALLLGVIGVGAGSRRRSARTS